MRIPLVAGTVLLVAVLSGCGTAGPDPAGTPTTPADGGATSTGPAPTPPSGTGRPTIPPPGDDSVPPDLESDPRVQAAILDAKGRVGIVAADVVVAGYSPVTWNDGSLGCPQKGRSYTQALVEGELLLLRSDQRVMSYHSGGGGDFTYCAEPSDGYTLRTG